MMHAKLCTALAFLGSALAALPQTASDPNEGSRMAYNPSTQVATFSWWGRAGATYFVKYSTDLLTWSYLPSYVSGGGGITLRVHTNANNAPRLFFRLRFTAAPYSTDFDGDGLLNGDETLAGWDPLDPDTNHDGIRDGISVRLGLDPGDLDSDDDGLSNAVELLLGTNPLSADTDGDGVADAVDFLPLDPAASGTGTGVTGSPVIQSLTSPPGAVLLP